MDKLLQKFVTTESVDDVTCDRCRHSTAFVKKLSIGKARVHCLIVTHTHTLPFNGPLSGTTLASWYQEGKTNLDYTGARDSEWQWRQLGHMQVCTSL